jgi:hypothetical protein
MAPKPYVLYSKKLRLLDARLFQSADAGMDINKQMAYTGKLARRQKLQSADALYYLTLRLKQSMRVLANVSRIGGEGGRSTGLMSLSK